MIFYKLNHGYDGMSSKSVNQYDTDSTLVLSIPFDPANTDYALFKEQINDDKAELQDADGNVMSPEAAKAFVATLP